MANNVNKMIKIYQDLMEGNISINGNSVKEEKNTKETKNKLDIYEKDAIISAYNEKAYSHKPPVVLTDFISRFCPSSNEETFFFFKALRDIERNNEIKNGEVLIAYALEMLKLLSDDYMPLSIKNYIEYKKDICEQLNNLVDFGIKSKILKIAEVHKEMINNINHSEATMEAEDSKNDKSEAPVEEVSESKVEKETTKDKKEEDKKKKEEKKKKNEENRKNTEKYFNYDSIIEVTPDLKDNKAAWYRVSNRVASLLIQNEVQELIGDQKFHMLIYQNTDDFAIINEQNNQIFWFKEKSQVEQFVDSNIFNMKWAEAHQADQLKFTA